MNKLGEALFRPVDADCLAAFRAVFGALMLWQSLFVVYPHIDDRYAPGVFHFTYALFDWVKPWPGAGMQVHVILMAAAAAGLMLGLSYHWSAVLFFLTYTYVFLIEKAEFNNHYYLICLLAFLFCIVDGGAGYSLDSALKIRSTKRWVPFWQIAVLRFQIVIVYFFGGVAKINADWLQGQPLLYWLPRQSSLPVIGPLLAEPWCAYFMSYTGLALDLTVGLLLLWRRTRIAAILLLVVFHGLNGLLFKIGVFPWLALAATLVFLEPGTVERLIASIRGGAAGPRTNATFHTGFRYRALVCAFLFAYAAIQILVPLRQHLYSGNAMWTEEGHDFAWRMKLSHKRGNAVFEVIDPVTGLRDVLGTPEQLRDLNARQRMQVLARPDMILQYAHFLRDKYRALGVADPIVRAGVEVSLNGRPFQTLIDPEADLAQSKQPWFSHADWILQLPDGLPIGQY